MLSLLRRVAKRHISLLQWEKGDHEVVDEVSEIV